MFERLSFPDDVLRQPSLTSGVAFRRGRDRATLAPNFQNFSGLSHFFADDAETAEFADGKT